MSLFRPFRSALLLPSVLALSLLLPAALPAGAETVSHAGIRGELLPEWDMLTLQDTLIFRANTQDAYIRVRKTDLAWTGDDFETPARAFAENMAGKDIRYVEGNVEFVTPQGEQAFLERFGQSALLFIVHGQGDDFYRVLGSIGPDTEAK